MDSFTIVTVQTNRAQAGELFDDAHERGAPPRPAATGPKPVRSSTG
jgi:hypothetical protein